MSESINARIKQLRKKKKLNQTEFGSVIGLKNSAISKMEQEGSVVVDQNIQLICEKFQVRREWLIDGIGEMFAARTKNDELMEWAKRVSQSPHDSFPYRLAEALSKLDEPQWKMLEQIFDEPPARTNDTARLHAQLDAELQAEREAVSASSATSSEKRA